MSLGRAAWPVIDVSAVAQLVETVRLVQDQLTEMTTAKEALLGQAAVLAGDWADLTGDSYTLTGVLADLDVDDIPALPQADDVREAYAGSAADVITQVLSAHQAQTRTWQTERQAWNDAQTVIASAGEFLEAVETTAAAQNSETTPGLSAQLDRQIAVSSSTRDIAARQLEIAVSSERRAAQLDDLRAEERARQQRQALLVRAEINADIADQQAEFDAEAFDRGLYAPVLPSYSRAPDSDPGDDPDSTP